MNVFKVTMKRKVGRNASKMPKVERERLKFLVHTLEVSGPVQPSMMNYSKLGPDKYHCHLSYRWVACWCCKNGNLEIEVYYVGSREKAPY